MNPADDELLYAPCQIDDSGHFGAMAYVEPVSTNRGQGYAVCAADGTQLAVFPDKEVAIFAALQHDLKPVLIH